MKRMQKLFSMLLRWFTADVERVITRQTKRFAQENRGNTFAVKSFQQDTVICITISKAQTSLGMRVSVPHVTQDSLHQITSFISRPSVTHVLTGGNAEIAGLRVGDVILAVNGKDLSNASHEETVNSLNAAQDPIMVEVLRRPTNTSSATTQQTSSKQTVATQTETLDIVAHSSKMFVVPAPPPLNSCCEEIHALSRSSSESGLSGEDSSYAMLYDKITLRRESSTDRIGLTLCYGEMEEDGMSDIFIGEVEPESVAGRNGRIQEGDQIIKINEQDVRNRAEAIKLFSESGANIELLICRPASVEEMDDGFLEEIGSNFEEPTAHDYLYAQDLKAMPLIPEEASEDEDEGTLTDTATLPSQKEKEGKDSGVGQDSPNSSEQECESSHYGTLNITEDIELPTEMGDSSKFRQLLESKCAKLSRNSVDQLCDRLNQLQSENNNRVVPRMGTKLIQHHAGDQTTPSAADINDTAYNTAESTPTTLELTKSLNGSSFSLSPSKKQSRRSHEKKRQRQGQNAKDSTMTNQTDITYTTEDRLAETMAIQQRILLQQSKTSTLAKEKHDVTEDTGNVTENSNMEWVVKRRSDGSRYITRRPRRNKLMKERKKKLETERCGLTTDDDAMSELKVGRHWSKEDRRAHVQRSREHQQRKAMMRQHIEMVRHAAREGQNNIIQLSHKKLHKHTMKDLDFATVQELLAHQGKIPLSSSNRVSVTTV